MQKNQLKLYDEFIVIETRIQIYNRKQNLLIVQHSDNIKMVKVCREEYSCQGEAYVTWQKRKLYVVTT